MNLVLEPQWKVAKKVIQVDIFLFSISFKKEIKNTYFV